MAKLITLYNPETFAEQKFKVGIAHGDKSTVFNSNCNSTNVLIDEWCVDYFNWFRLHRGETWKPKTKNNVENSNYIYIYTLEETIENFANNSIDGVFFSTEQDKRTEFYDENIVGIRIHVGENASNVVYKDSFMSKNALTTIAYKANEEGNSASPPTAPFNQHHYGFGFWYIPEDNVISFGSAYNRAYNNRGSELVNTPNMSAFNSYPSLPTVITYKSENMGDNVTIPSFSFVGDGAGTSLAVYQYNALKTEESANLSWYNNTTSKVYRYFLKDSEPPKDEYTDGGGDVTPPAGGGGNRDGSSDPIPLDPLPSTLVSGMVNVYKISSANMEDIHSFLWSDSLLDSLKTITQSPYECVLGLCALPYSASGTESTINFGNVDSEIGTTKVLQQFYEINCGTLNIDEYWGNFLDYSPYTSIRLYLPYIGIVTLDTDSFMSNTIQVIYRLDIVSGACIAVVLNNNGIVDTFSGNLATRLPLSMNDKSSIYADTITKAIGGAVSAVSGNVGGAVASTASMVSGMKSKPNTLTTYNGNNGAMLNMKPYLIISRPKSSTPDKFGYNKGVRSNITRQLSSAKGFCIVDSIHLDGIPCTAEERTQIENYLKNGVVI